MPCSEWHIHFKITREEWNCEWLLRPFQKLGNPVRREIFRIYLQYAV
jgi:hypothetical protein